MGRTVQVLEDSTQMPEAFLRVNELLKESGGCIAIDGGFATQLERHGADINDPLWSALCLITMPDLIRTVTVVLIQEHSKNFFCMYTAFLLHKLYHDMMVIDDYFLQCR